MPKPTYYLFTTRGHAREALFALLNRVRLMLLEDISILHHLIETLKYYRAYGFPIEGYDSSLIHSTLDDVIKTLEDESLIYDLIDRLKVYDDRFIATVLLGWFGSKAHLALPRLIDIARGSSSSVEVAKQSVILIGNAEQQIVLALRTSILDSDDGAFRELIDLVNRIGYSHNPDFENILNLAMSSENPHIRESLADAISSLSPLQKQQFLPFLERLAQDPEENVKSVASEALHQ